MSPLNTSCCCRFRPAVLAVGVALLRVGRVVRSACWPGGVAMSARRVVLLAGPGESVLAVGVAWCGRPTGRVVSR
jgi:hypothetical protein